MKHLLLTTIAAVVLVENESLCPLTRLKNIFFVEPDV